MGKPPQETDETRTQKGTRVVAREKLAKLFSNGKLPQFLFNLVREGEVNVEEFEELLHIYEELVIDLHEDLGG